MNSAMNILIIGIVFGIILGMSVGLIIGINSCYVIKSKDINANPLNNITINISDELVSDFERPDNNNNNNS